MVNNDGLIAAYMLDGKGGGQRVGWNEIRQWTPSNGLLWVHLNFTAPEAQRWIEEESQLENSEKISPCDARCGERRATGRRY